MRSPLGAIEAAETERDEHGIKLHLFPDCGEVANLSATTIKDFTTTDIEAFTAVLAAALTTTELNEFSTTI